jgi:hypothetical protein
MMRSRLWKIRLEVEERMGVFHGSLQVVRKRRTCWKVRFEVVRML